MDTPKVKVGDTVKLKPGIVNRQMIPEGREDNHTAKVKARLDEYARGALYMDRDLRGCKYWNEDDVLVITDKHII